MLKFYSFFIFEQQKSSILYKLFALKDTLLNKGALVSFGNFLISHYTKYRVVIIGNDIYAIFYIFVNVQFFIKRSYNFEHYIEMMLIFLKP